VNDTLTEGLSTGLNVIADFVPKLVLFLIILIVGLLVAKAFGRVVDRLLERVGFDRAVERGGIGRALRGSEMDATGLLVKLVYYAIVLFTLQLAINVFGPNPVSEFLTQITAFLPRVFVALVLVVVTAAIATAVKSLIESALGGLSYGATVAKVAAGFILALGIIAALNQVGIATTVTLPVLIAVLATASGILIVGVGGGLIRPMQSRWEGMLQVAELEGRALREQRRGQSSLDPQGSQTTSQPRV
jgi:hypothetical protein